MFSKAVKNISYVVNPLLDINFVNLERNLEVDIYRVKVALLCLH